MSKPELEAAYIVSQSACAIIEAMGMVAANKDRESRGFAIAYDEGAFQEVIEKYGIHHNAVMTAISRASEG